MVKMIHEETGNNISLKKERYSILKKDDAFLLKKISIEKKPLCYSFIGGMWYSKDAFSLEQDISLPYPFTTYYTTKILDKTYKGSLCRSLYYVKMPILILQFEDECICIEFDTIIQSNDKEIIPFISLSENKDAYVISFYIFNTFLIKEKDYAWLGIGKKKSVDLKLKQGDSFQFSVNIRKFHNWSEAVKTFVKNNVPKNVEIKKPEEIFYHGKKALFRSYDHLTGSFLQLPWRETPGFTFVNSSYSLLTYEAVRLHYFTKWYHQTKDEQFLEWINDLKALFTNPKLYKTDLIKGKGIVWYNMTNLTKKGLEGFFYMDCGYGGYPGGQGTIAFHLLKFLNYFDDKDIEDLVRKSLKYLLSTQNKNGSWPMAIRQGGILRVRSEKMHLYETHGGTAECIRALLAGFERFHDDTLIKAAKKGLRFLETKHPICYNGLRDIGINEPEAFSAVSIIDAYLDAYDSTKDEKYLENALQYALYTFSWIYFNNTNKLDLQYGFHPISFSITPRLSPYESMWIVSTYLRLYKVTKDKLWNQYAKAIYNEAVKWITHNGGLCEGIFPKYLSGMQRLSMEQTFATIEMLHATSQFFVLNKKSNEKPNNSKGAIKLKKSSDDLVVYDDNKEIMRFDARRCKVVNLKGCSLNEYGISFAFTGAYSKTNKIKRLVKNQIRGGYGKIILAASDAKFILKGVHAPKMNSKINIDPLEKYIKKWDFSINKNSAEGYCQTELHKIKYTISARKYENNVVISFNPLIIEVLDHDVSCKQTFFPVIGTKLLKKGVNELHFDGFSMKSDFRHLIETERCTAIDQTLATNWTYGGIYKGTFEIILKINQ